MINKALTIEGRGANDLVIKRSSLPVGAYTLLRVDAAGGDVVLRGFALENVITDPPTPANAVGVADVRNLTFDGVRVEGFYSQPCAVSITGITGDLTVTGSEFIDNDCSSSSGGAIQVWNTVANVTIAGSTFNGNEAFGSGGAVRETSPWSDQSSRAIARRIRAAGSGCVLLSPL